MRAPIQPNHIVEPIERKDLTREQKRILERIESEAKSIFQSLADRFLSEFIASTNPDGEEIKERGKQIDAQWQTYVKRRKLDPKGLTAIRQYINDVLKEYQESKEK